MNEPQQLVPVNEDAEVLAAKIEEAKRYYLTPKYKLWEEYFTKRKYSDTFGNATRAAAKAYGIENIDEDPRAYNLAHSHGHKNVQKCTNLKRMLLDQLGITHERMYRLYNDMVVKRLDVNMLYSLAEAAGIELPDYKQVVAPKTIGQNNTTQINASDVQVTFTSFDKK